MTEVADLMRRNLPAGATLATFGTAIGWGRGSDCAYERISTMTKGELELLGLTEAQAEAWAVAYEAVRQLVPTNPSAAGRAALMRHAAKLLGT
ncbi:MAG TPA: DUF4951 domain-containing protein [Pirellulales bacterium]|jgi:predicted DNA-binding transcriptional regulator YafY|nr:DUF4951 domain-containing protein [Pirellulales bacterium]